jgi:hypothetical protein
VPDWVIKKREELVKNGVLVDFDECLYRFEKDFEIRADESSEKDINAFIYGTQEKFPCKWDPPLKEVTVLIENN